MPDKQSTPAALGLMLGRLGRHEMDLVKHIKRITDVRRLKEAVDAGTALVQHLGTGAHLGPTIFGPEQQIVMDVSKMHKRGIKPRNPDVGALSTLVNAPDNVNVLPQVITAMDGTQAEATRKLRAIYVASRVAPISNFREPAASRTGKMEDMRRHGNEFDQRLQDAEKATEARTAETARAHRMGLAGGRRRKSRKSPKRTSTVRVRSKCKRRRGGSVTRRRQQQQRRR